MKKGYKIGIGIVITFLIAGYFYYTFPQKVNLTYNGIKYKLGDLQEQQEQIKITINGYYYNKLFSKDFFKGSISIDNEGYPSDESYPRLKLLVGEQLQMISYLDWEGDGTYHTYGQTFIGENLDGLTICVQNEQNGWNSEDGFMVSAPAENRVEALEISNKLMNSVLKKKLK